MRWLSWDADQLTRYAGILYFEHIIKPDFGIGAADPRIVEDATASFRKYARVLNDHLRGRAWLVGGSPTVADFAVALPYAERARIPLTDFPDIERWHARLEEFPAWRDPFPPTRAAA